MKWKIPRSTLGVRVGLFSAFFGFKAWKSLRLGRPIPRWSSHNKRYDFPGLVYLRKLPPLNDVHLLDGNFKIVRQMNELPVNANRIRW